MIYGIRRDQVTHHVISLTNVCMSVVCGCADLCEVIHSEMIPLWVAR